MADRPTIRAPAIPHRSVPVGALVGVLVVSPLESYLEALRRALERAEGLQPGCGGTFEAAVAALHGWQPRIAFVDTLSLATDREAVLSWRQTLLGLPFLLVGDSERQAGELMAMADGFDGYVRRMESMIMMVAKVRECLWRYR